MNKPYLSASMEALSDMYRSYPHTVIYRLDLGPQIAAYERTMSDYNITEEISSNLNPDELFFIIFEVLLTVMSDVDDIDYLQYMLYNQDELTFSISEYLNMELDTDVLHIPSKLIEKIIELVTTNVDKDSIGDSIYTIKNYITSANSVIVDIYVKEKVET